MRLFFAIVICAGALASSAASSQELLALTEEFKPYQYEDESGRPTGFMVELIDTVFENAGVRMEGGAVRIETWAAAYETLLNTDNAAAFMTVRTTDRENLLKWVGPLVPREMWLYKLKERDDVRAETLEEAKAYRIGGYRFFSGRFTVKLGLDRMIQLGTAVQVAGGLAGVALQLAGIVTVASIVGPVVVFMAGTGLAMPNAQAGAIGPFPRMAGSASALLGFFQMGLAALVGIAVGHGSGESAFTMLAAIALVALGGALAYWLVVYPAPQTAAAD